MDRLLLLLCKQYFHSIIYDIQVRRLQCPFIVKYLAVEVGEPGGLSYLVMKLYDCDLSTFIVNNKRLNRANSDVLAKSLAQGYFAISESNIVHRDIKPQNIMLVTAKPSEAQIDVKKQQIIVKAVISDFGCSKKKPQVTSDLADVQRSLVGSPLYMAPEVNFYFQIQLWNPTAKLMQSTS